MNGLRSNLDQYEFVLLSRPEGPVWRRDDWHQPERCLDNINEVKLGRRVKRVVQDDSSLIELCVPQPGGQALAQVHTGNGLRISKRGKYNGRGKILSQKATAKAGRYNKRPSKSP